MSDLLKRTESHEFAHRDVIICMKPDLLDVRDTAMARVASIQRNRKPVSDDRQIDSAVPASLAQALADVQAAEDEIRAASITLRLTGVDRLTYNRFVLACPPRPRKQEPFDSSKFFMYVARQTGRYVDTKGVVHEILDEEWAALDKIIDDGTHDRIAQAVIDTNRTVGAQDLGFFGRGSETTPDSSETSA